jgi:hypothetical protein
MHAAAMTGILDEALQRLHDTGPERDGWLSNHGPMAAEALVRHGHGGAVHAWLDTYERRLEEVPRGIAPIRPDEWREPLGDPVRMGDWLAFFDRAVVAEPWEDVLVRWWPRLLPGIAAGATHGVIRVGHAVRALREQETAARVAELGQGLAYWAARWQPLAAVGRGAYRSCDPRVALDAVPRVPDQRSGIRSRLAQLADLPGWAAAAGAVPGALPGAVPGALPGASYSRGGPGGRAGRAGITGPQGGSVEHRLAAIVAAAVRLHSTHGYGNPVMLVHAATAPVAVLRTLPVLPVALHGPSLAAAWAASAAVTAAYAPPVAQEFTGGDADAGAVLQQAADSGDAHAVKFADAAVEMWERDADPVLLAASRHATELIAAD